MNASSFVVKIPERFTFDTRREVLSQVGNVGSVSGKIVLDFTECRYIDSSALGAVLLIKQHLHNAQSLVLANCSGPVMETLKTVQFHKLFVIE